MSNVQDLLKYNPYPGRGIVTGLSPDGSNALIAYFIMGRSEHSRNRYFSGESSVLYTKPVDETKVKDPSLIIYAAIRMTDRRLIVTNGDQTDTISSFLASGQTADEALFTRQFEPDAPNYTPRISSVLDFRNEFRYQMSILKAADPCGSGCNRYFFNYLPVRGVGHLIHTYVTDGSPLRSFQGEPFPVDIPNDEKQFAKDLWESLNEENKISLCVKKIRLSDLETTTVIYNKYR